MHGWSDAGGDLVPFPKEAGEYVQTFEFEIVVNSEPIHHAAGARASLAFQLDALRAIDGLRDLVIAVHAIDVPDASTLLPSLPELSAHISEILDLASGATITVVFGDEYDAHKSITAGSMDVLETILQPLAGRSLDGLSIRGIDHLQSWTATPQLVAANAALAKVAPGVRMFAMEYPGWLLFRENKIIYPELERLALFIPVTNISNENVETAVASLCADLPEFINASSAHLKELIIDFPSIDLSAYEGNATSSLPCPKLQTLKLVCGAIQ